MPSRRLVSQEDRALIQRPDVPRSRFTGSWTRKTAFDADWLVPILLDEVLPGDHLQYSLTAFVRMATPLFPILDSQRIDTFFFFIPNRILWDNWKKFMGEQKNPGDSIDYLIPQITSPQGGYPVGSIYDHLTLPVIGQIPGPAFVTHNALPLRAYNLVYNEWFRDQNVATSRIVSTNDGPDASNWYDLMRRAKSHDYFTSALPWPQKFNAPQVPLGGLAPVIGLGTVNASANTGPVTVLESTGNARAYAYYGSANLAAPNALYWEHEGATGSYPAIFADLSEASGVAINTLRQAWLIQSLLERDARGGTRYVEMVRNHFGVQMPDYRASRPELIGTGSTPLTVSPIAQTAPTAEKPVGALGAAGTAVGQHRASYAATEHGWILGLINVRSELSYQQGLHKMWTRRTRYDHYFPSLAGLGEQAILRKEIYYQGDANDETVFGYQERWQEYRTRYSEVVGILRSGIPGTLDNWHLSQYHGTPPTLSESFIASNTPMVRVLAAGNASAGQQYIGDLLFNRVATRPMPVYGTPVGLGRF